MCLRDIIVFVLVSVVVIAPFIFLVYAINRDIEIGKECESMDGFICSPVGRPICFKKESLIQIP